MDYIYINENLIYVDNLSEIKEQDYIIYTHPVFSFLAFHLLYVNTLLTDWALIVTDNGLCLKYQGIDKQYKGRVDLPIRINSKTKKRVSTCLNLTGDESGFYYHGPVKDGQKFLIKIGKTTFKNMYSLNDEPFNHFLIRLKDWKKMIFPERNNIETMITSYVNLFNGCVHHLKDISKLYSVMWSLNNVDKNENYDDDKFLFVSGRFTFSSFNVFLNEDMFIFDNNKVSNKLILEQFNRYDRLDNERSQLLPFRLPVDNYRNFIQLVPLINKNYRIIKCLHDKSMSGFYPEQCYHFLTTNYKNYEYNDKPSLDYLNDYSYLETLMFDFPLFLKPSGLFAQNFKFFTELCKKYNFYVKDFYLDHQNIRVEDIGSTLYSISNEKDEDGCPKRPWKDEWFSYLTSGFSAHVILGVSFKRLVDDFKIGQNYLDCAKNYDDIVTTPNKFFNEYEIYSIALLNNHSEQAIKMFFRRLFSRLTIFKTEFRNQVGMIWTRNSLHTAVNMKELNEHYRFLAKRFEFENKLFKKDFVVKFYNTFDFENFIKDKTTNTYSHFYKLKHNNFIKNDLDMSVYE